MTNYRLFPSTNGPASPVAFSGNFISGLVFAVSGGGKWFSGYLWWVAASGQSTAPVKCALWSVTSGNGGVVVPGSVVTSGTLSNVPVGGEANGHWNFIPIPTPLQLAPSYDPTLSTNSSAYIAAIGCNGNFPDTTNFWASGNPGGNGIINGPLVAFSSNSSGTTKPPPWSLPQGVFTTGGSDPSTSMPNQASNLGDNFWVDVQISDTVPNGYNGTYRIWPNKSDMNPVSSTDSAVNYVIATEFEVTQQSTLNRIWYFSPPGTAQRATWAGVWQINGINSGTLMAQNASPTWSGIAASGWISTPISGTLPPGSYKVAVYNAAATPDFWGPKDAGSAYFDLGAGSNGIVNGPISVPNLANGAPAYNFADSNNISHYPPTGATVAHAQPTFAQPVSGLVLPAYPYLWAGVLAGNNSSQNYWVDVELTGPPAFTVNVTDFAGILDLLGNIAVTASVPDYAGVLDLPGITASMSLIDSAGIVEAPAVNATASVTDYAGIVWSMLLPESPNLTKTTAIQIASRVQENSSFSSAIIAGATYQGNMRQLAPDRWNYMYPS